MIYLTQPAHLFDSRLVLLRWLLELAWALSVLIKPVVMRRRKSHISTLTGRSRRHRIYGERNWALSVLMLRVSLRIFKLFSGVAPTEQCWVLKIIRERIRYGIAPSLIMTATTGTLNTWFLFSAVFALVFFDMAFIADNRIVFGTHIGLSIRSSLLWILSHNPVWFGA